MDNCGMGTVQEPHNGLVEALKHLEVVVAKNANLLECLEQKLDVVLMPAPPENDKGVAASPRQIKSKMSTEFDIQIERLESLNRRLAWIIERTDI